MALHTLKKRSEFLRVRNGVRWSCPSFVLEAKVREIESEVRPVVTQSDWGPEPAKPQARFGFTITKKIGNAVVRNRIRRRLRDVISKTAPALAEPHSDYVVIARKSALDRKFADLIADFEQAFRRVNAQPRPKRRTQRV